MKDSTEHEDLAWLDYRSRFADVYDQSNYQSPIQSSVMRSSHRLAEESFGAQDHFDNVLEVGAGTGEHFGFVRHSFDQYVLSDVDAKPLLVAERKLKGLGGEKLKYEPQSGEGLSYDDDCFDRLIATHVLEHICHPHLVLREWRRVIKDGGILSVLIPTDPGIAWRLGRHLGPRKRAMALDIDYDYVMAREHVNSSNNLIALLRHYFPERTELWWPFRIPSIDLNLFFVCHAKISKAGDVSC